MFGAYWEPLENLSVTSRMFINHKIQNYSSAVKFSWIVLVGQHYLADSFARTQ